MIFATLSDLVFAPLVMYAGLFYNSFYGELSNYSSCFYIQTTYVFTLFYVLTKALKNWLHKFPGEIFKRPLGAKGCDYISDINGNSLGPGFPSEHMSTLAFMSVVIIAAVKPKYRISVTGLLLIIGLLVAKGRLETQCHTQIQVVAGLVWGTLGGLTWLYISSKNCKS